MVAPVGTGHAAVLMACAIVAVPRVVVRGFVRHRRLRRLAAEQHRRGREPLQGQRGHDEPGDDETQNRHEP